ncbi:Aca2/YdiL-like domain-containing protein [Nocardia cerradoensis]|uniref:Uncharacterized protein n=1 Tax=Nocardia cerradoensis TaxID=85688 RepID=A0A231GTH5_9NOCA|nr:DUF1870 family protein [Nocardia cerradoensis]NKY47997.1 DUF1870 family protein [Nocardia cerradoensis]OXR39919.1 hypothetical protein B7C42_08024 [Nocardia cerradoensis]
MTHPKREFGRSAQLQVARRYFGVERPEFGDLLGGVRPNTVQSWESGRDPIPSTIWSEIDRLYARFESEVEELVVSVADQAGDRIRVRVWRAKSDHCATPQWWQRVVAEAMRRDPRIEPVYPEDDKDD